MKRHCIALFCLLFLFTCDDGDIITVDLEFDQELERCDDFEESYLIYDTREDPDEALILILPKPDSDYLFTDVTETPVELAIPSEAQFYYRKYSEPVAENALCNILSDPNLTVTENNPATAGTVSVSVVAIDDDNDGIPSIDEYGPGGIDDPRDTDGDGIFDYLDQDDDNDNVETRFELDDNDEPIDTDNDGVPDHLDDDDDGDGVPTRLEDANENQNPRNTEDQVLNTGTGEDVYRYLYNHPSAMEAFNDSGFIDNTYLRTVFTTFTILYSGIGPVSATEIQLGTYESPSVEITQENN